MVFGGQQGHHLTERLSNRSTEDVFWNPRVEGTNLGKRVPLLQQVEDFVNRDPGAGNTQGTV